MTEHEAMMVLFHAQWYITSMAAFHFGRNSDDLEAANLIANLVIENFDYPWKKEWKV